MDDQATENASARIERALARIEAAAGRAVADRADLQRRHDRLRAQVSDAIASLDSVIDGEGDV